MTHPAKLTLRHDSGLIESAKAFAQEHQRSLSQLVADYFARLAAQSASSASKVESVTVPATSNPLGPITASLRGSWAAAPSRKKGQSRPVTIDDYHAYLVEKHK